MIIADVNVLVYAFREGADDHRRYRTWLLGAINGPTDFGLTDATLIGFARVVTNRRIYEIPASSDDTRHFISSIVTAPRSRWIGPSTSTWAEFDHIMATDRRVLGNLVPDAWLAALAISHGGRLATADRGFARYDRLDWFDPAAA